MDPKTMPNLDPKLRETYERVMGTTLKPSSVDKTRDNQKPTAPQTSPTASLSAGGTPGAVHKPESVSAAAIAQMGGTAHEATPPVKPVENTSHSTTTVRLDATNEEATHPAKDVKKKGKISPVFFIIGGVVFFVVYGLFWAKVLHLPLPF